MKAVHFLIHLSFWFKFLYSRWHRSGFYYRFPCAFFVLFHHIQFECDTYTSTHIHSFKRVTGKKKEIENYFNSSPQDYYSKLSEARECRQSGGRQLMLKSSTFRFLKPIKHNWNDSQVFDCFQWLWWWWWWWWLRLRWLAQQNALWKSVWNLCHLSLDLNLGQWDKAYSIHSLFENR